MKAISLKSLICAGLLLIPASFTPIPALSQATDNENIMSIDTAILFALTNNPDLNIVNSKDEQAKYAIDEARSSYYPQVDLSASIGQEYNNPAVFKANSKHSGRGHSNTSNDYSLTVNQLLYDGKSTISEVRKREQLLNSSEYKNTLVQQKIILDTIKSYMKIYQYHKSMKEAKNLIDQISIMNKKVALMVDAGAEDLAKSKYVQSRLSFAKSELTNADASLSEAMSELEFLTGNIPKFKAKKPDFFDVLSQDLQSYFKLASSNNTNLLLNESDKKANEFELDKTKGRFLPTLNMVMEYDQSIDSGGEIGKDKNASLILQMNYKIFDGYGRKATTNRVEKQISESSFKSERIERDIRKKIKSQYNQIFSLEQELSILEEEIITNIDLQKIYQEQFELGEGDIFRLIEGQERLYRSKIRKYRIESNIIIQSFELIKQIGFLDKSLFCDVC